MRSPAQATARSSCSAPARGSFKRTARGASTAPTRQPRSTTQALPRRPRTMPSPMRDFRSSGRRGIPAASYRTELDDTNVCSYTSGMRAEYREEPCRSALNRVKGMRFDWSLNPYMGCVHRCTFCYVRAFERRAERPSDDRYGRSIRVKTNVADVLRKELARPSWEGGRVAIGAATDPYQPVEGKYLLTRACIEVLGNAGNPFTIITRGPMIVRDVDVLVRAAARAEVSVTFSIPTIDDEIWRKTEPGTAPPHQRLRALQQLVDAGIRVGVGMAPILPGLSDKPELMEDVVRAARAAGATGIWANILYLKPGTREHYLAALGREWPELLPQYEELYARKAYLDATEVRATVRELARKHGVRDRRPVRLEPPDDEAE